MSTKKGQRLNAEIREKRDFEVSRVEGPLLLDWTDDLYRYDLNGHPVSLAEGEMAAQPISGMCPLCNNNQWREIDQSLLSGITCPEIRERFGAFFTDDEIAIHAADHLMPVSTAVLENFFPESLRCEAEEFDSSALDMSRIYLREGLRAPDVDEESSPVAGSTGQDSSNLAPAHDQVYAIENGVLYPMKIWSPKRMESELRDRAQNNINFMDEMMRVRKMSYHVYKEVITRGQVKDYGIAMTAVREIRGVVETLGKFSLIAKQLGDDEGKMKRLSPQMQDMIAKLGIGQIEQDEETAEMVKNVTEVGENSDFEGENGGQVGNLADSLMQDIDEMIGGSDVFEA